ncbi:MAG: ankyrin repeat domain-containing protein [Verrucomicrobiae bacterium]|nr:ankyrin repeat domain-containing protein [Verrucomicrobiae bacterium]
MDPLPDLPPLRALKTPKQGASVFQLNRQIIQLGMVLVVAIAAVAVLSMYRQRVQEKFFAEAKIGNITGIEKALRQGARINDQDKEGMTALMYASMEGHVKTVCFLLKNSADPSLKNHLGITALELARLRDHPEIAAILEISAAPPGGNGRSR